MNSEEKTLYYADDKRITDKNIECALVESGVKKGDIVLVHSDIRSFGRIGDVKDKREFLESLLSAFLHVLGREGTIVAPTYTYSFCKKEIFDVKKSKSETGLFSEFIRNHPLAIRSEDPIFSHAAIGRHAERLLENISDACFGEDSFFDRFLEMDGKIINFGKFFDITFLHYIEKKFGVDYRFDKKFSGTIVLKDGKKKEKDVVYYVRYLQNDGGDVEYHMPFLGDTLERRGLLKRIVVGNSFLLCSRAQDCYAVGIEMLEDNKYSFLKSDPHAAQKDSPRKKKVADLPGSAGRYF